MSKNSPLRRRDKLFAVALVAGLTVAGYWAFEYRKSFIQSFFPRGPGDSVAPKLPSPQTAAPLIRPGMEYVRVLLLDGVDRETARTMESYNALCQRGLDLEVDVGFPSVSLPVQAVLWTGLTQQQSGIQYVWKPLSPPLDGVPGAIEGSTAVAEDYQYIVHSLGFDRIYPKVPKFDDKEVKRKWMDETFEKSAIAEMISPERLVFVHILRADTAAHKTGRESEAFRQAVTGADELLAKLTTAVSPGEQILWLVLSDHGHIAGGGHAGSEPRVRIVRACIAGGGISPAKIERRVHMVDIYRVLETALDVATELDSAGRELGAAIAAPDSTGATLPTPGVRWIPAVLVIAVALLAALLAGSQQLWSFAWLWLILAYVSVVLLEGTPTLSNPMIYKPLGKTMYMAALPGLIALALAAGVLLRRHGPGRVTIVLLGPPAAFMLASYLLCRGEPPLMPVWTAHTSLLLTLLATGCWVVALAHLVVSVPREFGLVKARGTSRKSP